jgi:hypothetical protein
MSGKTGVSVFAKLGVAFGMCEKYMPWGGIG